MNLNLARKISAHSTFSAWKSIPHVAFIHELGVDGLYARYLALKQEGAGKARVSFNVVMMKVIAEALDACPALNESFDYRSRIHSLRFTRHESVDLNIPWILPTGETIPILFKDVARKPVAEIAHEMEEVRRRISSTDIDGLFVRVIRRDTREKLRKGKLSAITRIVPIIAAELGRGARFRKPAPGGQAAELPTERVDPDGIVVSNVGSIMAGANGSFSLLEIVEPRIIAIGLGAVVEKPVVASSPDGSRAVGIGKVLDVCIAFDHRAIDFNSIAPFIRRLDEIVGDEACVAQLLS